MKRLFVLIIISLCKSSLLVAGELDDIELIAPLSYNTPSSSSQTLKSNIKVEIGDLINIDIVAEVKKKLLPYRQELLTYFPNSHEFDSFIDKILVEGKNSIIGDNLSDDNLMKYYDHLGNNLIGPLVDKILNTNGVKDPERRSLWVHKILGPFQACMHNANNALYDADRCMNALTASLVQSTGIGIVYELSRLNLTTSLPEDQKLHFDREQVNLYKSCLKKTSGIAFDVKDCGLQAMKSGTLSICDLKLTKTLNDSASSSSAAQTIKESVWPKLTRCTQDVKQNPKIKIAVKEQLMDCIDNLIQNTGVLLVQDKVSNTPVVKSNFTSDEIKNLTLKQSTEFQNCMTNQKKNNVRKNGMLDTAKCNADVTKSATKEIVLAFEKKQLKKQLNTEITPSKLKIVEDNLITCTDQEYPVENISQAMDVCTKNFALDFASILGGLKVDVLFKSLLGSKGFSDQEKNINGMLEKYNLCLDGLKTIEIKDGMIERLFICMKDLQNRGEDFISNMTSTWMNNGDKDAKNVKIKNNFSNILPCFGSIIPAAPYTQTIDDNIKSTLKPAAILLAQYIDYSPENAQRTLDEIIHKLSTDLKDVASNPTSRQALLNILYENGALDQFLKAMIRAKVQDSFQAIPESDLPSDLQASLLNKENFDKIFATPEGQAIKDIAMTKILTPVLQGQVSLRSPLMVAEINAAKARVVKMLIYSPNFGEQLMKSGIQNKINEMNGITHFFAKTIYGQEALDWDKVRTTKEGKLAEEYIKNTILLPKFNGQKFSPEEDKKNSVEAERLVTEAIKNYE